MNLNLSDEQEFLREAARGALSRVCLLYTSPSPRD